MYYVYSDSTLGHVRVHHGDCRFCNHGKGCQPNAVMNLWTGPFDTRTDAMQPPFEHLTQPIAVIAVINEQETIKKCEWHTGSWRWMSHAGNYSGRGTYSGVQC